MLKIFQKFWHQSVLILALKYHQTTLKDFRGRIIKRWYCYYLLVWQQFIWNNVVVIHKKCPISRRVFHFGQVKKAYTDEEHYSKIHETRIKPKCGGLGNNNSIIPFWQNSKKVNFRGASEGYKSWVNWVVFLKCFWLSTEFMV